MAKIHKRYQDRAEFFAVYIKEAHPSDGWKSKSNERVGITLTQPTSFEERVKAASQCCGALELTIPMVVDGMDNRVGEAYSGFPDRLYLIDRNGKVALKSGRGPFGFIPAELEQSLILLLMEEAGESDGS